MTDGVHLRVIAGRPTAEEIAALVVAVDRLGARRAAPPRSASGLRPADRPGWARAARVEALGAAPVSAPADLHRLD